MRTLLWKEFRETWKWGLLLLIASAIRHVWLQAGTPRQITLFSSAYLAFVGFAFPLGALLLGVLQTVFEAQRDRWAYLRHRAITPEKLLLAKMIVGLSLYVTAALIPLLLLAVWESLPGNVPAPFAWSALVGGLTMLLAGVAFWFAGALIGVRDVRWYGTRLLPVGLPIVGTAGMLATLEQVPPAMKLLVVSVIAAVTVAAMATATLGAFRHRSGYLNQTHVARWCLALSSAFGLLVLAGFSSLITTEILRLFGAPFLMPGQAVVHEIDRKGRLLRIELDNNPDAAWKGRLRTNSLSVADASQDVDREVSTSDLVPFVSLHHSRGNHDSDDITGRDGEDGPWMRLGRYEIYSGLEESPIHWFFSHDEGVLLGYEHKTRRLTWRAGPEGVIPADRHVPRRFSGGPTELTNQIYSLDQTAIVEVIRQAALVAQQSGNSDSDQSKQNRRRVLIWQGQLLFDDGLYSFDRKQPRLTRSFAVKPPARLHSVAVPQSMTETESVAWMVLDRTIRKYLLADQDKVHVQLGPQGIHQLTDDLLRQEFTIPEELLGVGQFGFAHLPERNLVVYRVTQYSNGFGEKVRIHTLVASPAGKIVRHIVSNWEHDYLSEGGEIIGAFVIPAVPMTTLTALFASNHQNVRDVRTLGVAIESVAAPPSKAISIVMWSSSLLSLLVTAVLVRRWRFSRTSSLGWLAATVVLGPTGLLTLLAIRERVVNVTCSGCQAPRPRTSERCPHCDQLFAEPERNGTEIFATLTESKLSRSSTAC